MTLCLCCECFSNVVTSNPVWFYLPSCLVLPTARLPPTNNLSCPASDTRYKIQTKFIN